MPRLPETKEVLDAIRLKAYQNSKKMKTYGTRAEFDLGRGVVSFAEQCDIFRHLGNANIEH